MKLFAGIEAGGTKFVCGVGPADAPRLVDRDEFPTGGPEETLGRVRQFLGGYPDLAGVGLASFGPVDLRAGSSTFGHITTTPKTAWQGVDILGAVRSACPGVPAAFDTDVNAAAVAEHRWGSARGTGSCAYVTVGTGIGGGLVVAGRPVHGAVHPEMGHMRIPHDRDADPYPGGCPFHGDCWEGLASGPALRARWDTDPADLPDDHPGWVLQAGYLAAGLANLVLAVSPERIVLGGGVGTRAGLLDRVRTELDELIARYVDVGDLDSYLVAPQLGRDAGVLGAIALGASRASGVGPVGIEPTTEGL